MENQKDQTKQAFTTQADSYANSAIIAADEPRRRFVEFVAPRPTDRVLDVATGPGFLAFNFAARVAEVMGTDITPAMLSRAEVNRVKRDLGNVKFQEGDAESLPFPDASFDVATCGSAFHHFANPVLVLSEMARVVRPGGTVALTEIITSEDEKKAAFHNRLENMRDPSHTRSIALSELVAMFEAAGLHDIRTRTLPSPRELKEWFAISHTSPELAKQISEEFIASIPDDAAGLSVYQVGEDVHFCHSVGWVVGIK